MPDQDFIWAGIEKNYPVFIITSMVRTPFIMAGVMNKLCPENRKIPLVREFCRKGKFFKKEKLHLERGFTR